MGQTLIETTKGLLPEESLEKRTGDIDNDHEQTSWVEYWLDGELVHRSAHVHLKTSLETFLTQGAFA